MKFVLAGYGSRGDVEPCAAVGRELRRRGHDVRMAVPPDKLGFVESAGLAAVAYGPDTRERIDAAQEFVRNVRNPIGALPEAVEHLTRTWMDKSATLTSLAQGADLLVAGINEQKLAANVAEYHGIPLAALHFFPARILSTGLLYSATTAGSPTPSAVRSVCRRRPSPRRNRARWRFRPTTRSACPGRPATGWNRMADGPSSAR